MDIINPILDVITKDNLPSIAFIIFIILIFAYDLTHDGTGRSNKSDIKKPSGGSGTTKTTTTTSQTTTTTTNSDEGN